MHHTTRAGVGNTMLLAVAIVALVVGLGALSSVGSSWATETQEDRHMSEYEKGAARRLKRLSGQSAGLLSGDLKSIILAAPPSWASKV